MWGPFVDPEDNLALMLVDLRILVEAAVRALRDMIPPEPTTAEEYLSDRTQDEDDAIIFGDVGRIDHMDSGERVAFAARTVREIAKVLDWTLDEAAEAGILARMVPEWPPAS